MWPTLILALVSELMRCLPELTPVMLCVMNQIHLTRGLLIPRCGKSIATLLYTSACKTVFWPKTQVISSLITSLLPNHGDQALNSIPPITPGKLLESITLLSSESATLIRTLIMLTTVQWQLYGLVALASILLRM